MADTVASQILLNGPRNCVMKFTNQSDGTGETAVVKVDVSTMAGTPQEVRIVHLEAFTSGMGVDVLWGADTDVLAFTIPADIDDEMRFDQPLVNNAGLGKTGDIKFTTVGADNGDSYSIILYMKKVEAEAAVTAAPEDGDAYLLESGGSDKYLLETGDVMLLNRGENWALDENGEFILTEDGEILEFD